MSWPIDEYVQECSLELAPRTVTTYRSVLRDAERRSGVELSGLTRRHLVELAAAWKHRDQNLSALRGFLKWCRHELADQVPKGRPPGQKRELRWYSIAELEAVVAACDTPRDRLIVHLALELMLRRCEIERLRWEDLEPTSVRVLGKGRHGGKVRRIPYHPYTRRLLEEYRRGDATQQRPPAWPRPPTLLGLRKSRLQMVLQEIETNLRWEGVNLSLEFHALRRTGGRLFVQAGVRLGKHPLEVLNELRGIYGHASIVTTMHYVGWDVEEAAETMTAMPRLEGRQVLAPIETP